MQKLIESFRETVFATERSKFSLTGIKNFMKLLFLIIIFAVFLIPCLAQGKSPIYSDNKISGSVLDYKSRPIAKIKICVYSAERPQQGRAPCSKTDDKGNFDFTANIIIGEKFVICASTQTDLLEKKNPRHVCSEPVIFESKDENKIVELKFKEKIKFKAR